MLERSQNSYPLLRQFREFYAEIARLRRFVEDARSSGEIAPEGAFAAASGPAEMARDGGALQLAGSSLAVEEADAVGSRVWYEMTRFLDRKMYEVKVAASPVSQEILRELVYIMAAYADETFVCLLDWSGKDYWADHLMELRLFRSQIAGQEIFRRIDRVLARQDYGTEELAAVYLMVLALGFKGQYLRDPASVEAYRKKLFDRLLLTNPELRWDGRRMFPEAYRHTVSEGAPVRLPEPGRWWWGVGGIVAAWLILSTIAWLALTSPTRKTLAVTMQSLDIVTNRRSVSAASSKWRALPFELQGGAFRLALPTATTTTQAGANQSGASRGAQASAAPLLIAVDGPSGSGSNGSGSNNSGAGSAAQVRAWLSSGVTSFAGNLYSGAPRSREVASVAQILSPPDDLMESPTTLFFLVDPGLGAQDLTLRPQLAFPVDGSVRVASVTLYLPEQLTAGAQ
jgi:type VI secretion system protein ImpK